MRKIVLFLMLSFLASATTVAQIERCAQEELLSEQLERFPDMENRMKELALEMNQWQANAANQRSVITIPVVVHVLYKEEEENIPDLQIYSQIEVLNEDFRLLNENVEYIPGEFEGFAADTEIEFCLASIDPNGMPTTGINRVPTDYDCIGNIFSVKENGKARMLYSVLGGVDAWDTEQYLNIWVGNTCKSFLGVATNIALQDFAPQEDGIVLAYNAFGNNCNSSEVAPYHLGRTATHEIGHFFNLSHPWGTCGATDPDGVADTPPQAEPYFGCPSYPSNSCGSSDMYMNFMNYTDDVCMAMFTKGQKERMMATLAGPRNGLTESVGCALLSPTLPFSSEAINLYPNPVTNCIHIDFNAEIPGNIDVEMVNAQGQVLYKIIESSRNFRSIDASALPNGIYYVSFRAAKQIFTKKVMVIK